MKRILESDKASCALRITLKKWRVFSTKNLEVLERGLQYLVLCCNLLFVTVPLWVCFCHCFLLYAANGVCFNYCSCILWETSTGNDIWGRKPRRCCGRVEEVGQILGGSITRKRKLKGWIEGLAKWIVVHNHIKNLGVDILADKTVEWCIISF